MIDLEKFLEKYNAASPQVRVLLESNQIRDFCHEFFKEKQFTSTEFSEAIRCIGDFFLEIIDVEELRKTLKLSPEESASFLEKINDLKKTPIDGQPVPDAKSGLKEKLELRPDVVAGVENTALKDPHMSVQPLTRESILNTLSPKRTMAEDIAELKEKKELPHQGYESYVAAKETKE